MSHSSRKRSAINSRQPDIEDGYSDIDYDALLNGTPSSPSVSRKDNGKDSDEDTAEQRYTDGTTVYHQHHHTHSIKVEGGLEAVTTEPYTEFGITSGLQCIVGWIMCLFSYIFLAIFIWLIVVLST